MALDALTIGDEQAIPDISSILRLRDAYWRLDERPVAEVIASVVEPALGARAAHRGRQHSPGRARR